MYKIQKRVVVLSILIKNLFDYEKTNGIFLTISLFILVIMTDYF